MSGNDFGDPERTFSSLVGRTAFPQSTLAEEGTALRRDALWLDALSDKHGNSDGHAICAVENTPSSHSRKGLSTRAFLV